METYAIPEVLDEVKLWLQLRPDSINFVSVFRKQSPPKVEYVHTVS